MSRLVVVCPRWEPRNAAGVGACVSANFRKSALFAKYEDGAKRKHQSRSWDQLPSLCPRFTTGHYLLPTMRLKLSRISFTHSFTRLTSRAPRRSAVDGEWRHPDANERFGTFKCEPLTSLLQFGIFASDHDNSRTRNSRWSVRERNYKLLWQVDMNTATLSLMMSPFSQAWFAQRKRRLTSCLGKLPRHRTKQYKARSHAEPNLTRHKPRRRMPLLSS